MTVIRVAGLNKTRKIIKTLRNLGREIGDYGNREIAKLYRRKLRRNITRMQEYEYPHHGPYRRGYLRESVSKPHKRKDGEYIIYVSAPYAEIFRKGTRAFRTENVMVFLGRDEEKVFTHRIRAKEGKDFIDATIKEVEPMIKTHFDRIVNTYLANKGLTKL